MNTKKLAIACLAVAAGTALVVFDVRVAHMNILIAGLALAGVLSFTADYLAGGLTMLNRTPREIYQSFKSGERKRLPPLAPLPDGMKKASHLILLLSALYYCWSVLT
jgi:hypothetical protein